VLFRLAELFPAFYENHDWHNTLARVAMQDAQAADHWFDLAAHGVFEGRHPDRIFLVRELAGLLEAHPALRERTYRRLEHGPSTPGLVLLAEAVGEAPDVAGLLLLSRPKWRPGGLLQVFARWSGSRPSRFRPAGCLAPTRSCPPEQVTYGERCYLCVPMEALTTGPPGAFAP
jgi:hypothetical protein